MRGFERSSADISLDPKGVIGGPVFEIVARVEGDLSFCLMAITVECRRDGGVMFAARTPTVEPLLNRIIDRSI
ncbi:hypothetical protein [Aureimonas sp. AU12]|uniref:hypothetical protein n=1 Tax=Aureimonas sp. AU12 TaxID=1638161 RepID=UPI0012E3E4C6|nr:hypothetical protein [Aureimonas sp. AU12]